MRIAPEFICDCLCKYKEQAITYEHLEAIKESFCSKCPVRYQKDDFADKAASELKSISSELKNITKKLGGLKR